MKKLIILFVMVISAQLFSWDGGYSIKCYACRELTLFKNRGYSNCTGCPMWRCYWEESSTGKNAGYMVYRCQHGHKILIPFKSEDKSRDLHELIVEKADGTRKPLDFADKMVW